MSVLDRKWREHLYEMDYLKEGIGLRAMAQRDPLVEYQREGFDMFNGMLDGLKEESVGFLFHLQVEVAEPEQPQPEVEPVPSAMVESAVSALSNGNGSGGPQHAAPEGNGVPAALRGKGLGGEGAAPSGLTYSGPAEDGGVASRGGEQSGESGAGSTRRERREAARAEAKAQRKQRTKNG
jgi:preprotein translocase subunit SecA